MVTKKRSQTSAKLQNWNVKINLEYLFLVALLGGVAADLLLRTDKNILIQLELPICLYLLREVPKVD